VFKSALKTSPARRQTLDVALRQNEFFHALLHGSDIVGRPVELPQVQVGLVNGVSGARIAVARLPDRTGIQDGAYGRAV
jgi:hypothetical protein